MFHIKQFKIQNKNQNLKTKNYFGFTLVELIVVIVILAILATIAFLSFNSYSASSRDSVRVTDINSIKKSLEMYNVTGGAGYPMPDSYTGVTFSGGVLWYQGFIGDQVARVISSNLSKKPIDPLFNNEYTYSLLGNKREYQIKSNLESGKIGYNGGLENIGLNDFNIFDNIREIPAFAGMTNLANAASNSGTTCYINGNFNGLLGNSKDSGNTNYILAVPSLILTDPNNGANTTFTGGNLSRMGSGILQCNGQNDPCVVNYNSSNIIYTGTPTTTSQATTIAQNLQQAYSGSNITNLTAISTLLSSTGQSLTSIGVGVVQKSVGTTALQDCPMGDDWNGSSCVPDSKTVLLMHFDNNYNNSGLASGGNASNVGTVFTGGQFGGAASFNGFNNYIDISGGSSPSIYSWGMNTDFTIDFWVYKAGGGDARLFDLSGPGGAYSWNIANGIEWYVYVTPAGNCGFQNYSGVGTEGGDYIGCGTVPLNKWTHLVIERSGNTIKTFQDGVQKGTTTQTAYGVIGTKQLRMGRTVISASTQYLNGYLDEVRISRGVARWTSDFTPPNRPY